RWARCRARRGTPPRPRASVAGGSRRSRAPHGSRPCAARAALPSRAARSPARSSPCAAVAAPPGRRRTHRSQELLRGVENRGCNQLLGRLRDAALTLAGDEDDLVLSRVEPDVRARDVVVDDEVDVLLVEHPPLAIEPGLPVLGAEGDEDLPRPLALAEGPRDVGRRLELERPGRRRLPPLPGHDLRR